MLRDGDILFIDSTHSVKYDSDCPHICLRILPAIKSSITVHVHDIFLPRSLPLHMLRGHQIHWHEQCLPHAYSQSNPRPRTIFGSHYHFIRDRPALNLMMHGRYEAGGASFWFEQTKGHQCGEPETRNDGRWSRSDLSAIDVGEGLSATCHAGIR